MTTEDNTMKITAPCVITLTWSITDSMHEEIDEIDVPTDYFYGGGDLFPKIEEALLDAKKGQVFDLYLEPEHAFGEYISGLVFFENSDVFPDATEIGMQFEGLPVGAKSDAPKDIIYSVTEVYDDYIVVDGNHPLAGISLRLHIEIVDIREATEEEIKNRSTSSKGLLKLVSAPPSSSQIH